MKISLSLSVILLLVQCACSLLQGTTMPQSNSRFMASVRLRSLDQSQFGSGYLCGATVISTWSVVTVASCIAGRSASELQIAMGTNELNRRSVVINVARISIHENFTATDPLSNNIAVLRLSMNIRHNNRRRYSRNRNSHIQPISLDTSQLTPTTCPVFAWYAGNNLLRASLPILNEANCGNFSSGLFCAGNVNGGPAVCTRNIGGAMICNNRITGFVIEDTGCGVQGTSGHFLSISHHQEWIRRSSTTSVGAETSVCLLLIAFIVQLFC